jgi:hypothetical protein
MAPLWELFPSQPSTPDIILAQLQAIQADRSGISPAQDPLPTALPDSVACQEIVFCFELFVLLIQVHTRFLRLIPLIYLIPTFPLLSLSL